MWSCYYVVIGVGVVSYVMLVCVCDVDVVCCICVDVYVDVAYYYAVDMGVGGCVGVFLLSSLMLDVVCVRVVLLLLMITLCWWCKLLRRL